MSTALSCMYYDKSKCTFSFFFCYNLFVYFLAPLQPLGINGREQRNRILSNGPIVHHQPTSVLPPASSLQSLSPLVTTTHPTGNVAFTIPTTNIEQQSLNFDNDEKEKLKNDLEQLKTELQKSKETIARLQKSEEQMRER